MKYLTTLTLALLLIATGLHAQQPVATNSAKSASAKPVAVPAPPKSAISVQANPVTQPVAPAQSTAPASPDELGCNVLTGRVTDMYDHPLMGASVVLRSRNSKSFNTDAFITNAEGQYMVSSKQPIPRNTVLEITAGGYTSFAFPLTNCQPIDASLEPLPGTRFKSDGRIKKTSASGKIH